VYGMSFADPAGYFLATRVQMHNKDVIFVANAAQFDITNFANFLNTLISVPVNGIGLASSTQAARIIFHTPNPTATTPIITTTTVGPTTVTTPAH
jgi:polysaccharide biosynthesis/export protein